MYTYFSNLAHIYVAEPKFYKQHLVKKMALGFAIGLAFNVVYDKKVMFPEYAKLIKKQWG